MNTITKYTVVNNTFEKIAVSSFTLTRKLENLRINEDAIIEISAKVPFVCEKTEIEAVIAEIKSKLIYWCRNGFAYNGNRYFPIGVGSRKTASLWLREDLLPVVGKAEL